MRHVQQVDRNLIIQILLFLRQILLKDNIIGSNSGLASDNMGSTMMSEDCVCVADLPDFKHIDKGCQQPRFDGLNQDIHKLRPDSVDLLQIAYLDFLGTLLDS